MNLMEKKMTIKFSKRRILKSASTPRPWFDVVDKKEEERARVNIYDQIGMDFWGEGITAKAFVEEVSNIKAKAIDLHIKSPGGDVYDGYAIYNEFTTHL